MTLPLRMVVACAALAAAIAAGCNGSGKDTAEETGSQTGETGTTSVSPFSMMSDEFGPGMLLSAWTDAGRVLMVGGDLGGGEGMIAWYDGETLCWEAAPPAERALWWVHGPRGGDWYAVGEQGLILHEVDGLRTREDVPTDKTLFGVWAVSDDEVWAVGGDVDTNVGEVWKRTGGTWALHTGAIDGVVFKVWEDWFVGSEITLHLDADVLVEEPITSRLTTVRGRADDDAYAIGGSASVEVVHWDGAAWSAVALPSVWGVGTGVYAEAGDDRVWVTGTSGFMGAYDITTGDMIVPDFPFTSETFHAVWPFEDEVLFVGGNFLTSGTDYYSIVGRYGTGEKSIVPTECP